jgi:hypothetical protein
MLDGAIAQIKRRRAHAVFILRLINPNESFRVRKRQRPQKRAFDNGKDGGVRTDAESESQNGDRGEAGRLHQHSQSVFQVSQHNRGL